MRKALMSIGKKTNLTDPPIQPSRESHLPRAMPVLVCLVIFATTISLYFIIRSSHQPGAEQNFAKESAISSAAISTGQTYTAAPAAPQPLEAQETKTRGPAPEIPHMLDKGARKSVAGIRARD